MLRGILVAAALIVFPTVASAQQPCTTDARRVVDELYRHMLERSADAASSAWVERLMSGSTVRDVVCDIAKSTEHMQRFYNPGEGAVANERAVANLYRHILGRQPDAAGLRSLTDLADRNGLAAVVDAIIASPEYERTFGDWGVPGSGGIRYCGTGASQSTARYAGEIRFAAMDTNHNGVIERSEWRGNARSFRIHDWNGDGVLSGEEVRVGATPPPDSLEARDYNMTIDDRFDYLDVNNNGFIEENEWDGSIETFDRLDRNNDGRLTRVELGNARGASFNALDVDRDGRIELREWPWSHRSFDEQDENGDGVITRDEFRSGAVPTTGR